jgi:hypothetical protein
MRFFYRDQFSSQFASDFPLTIAVVFKGFFLCLNEIKRNSFAAGVVKILRYALGLSLSPHQCKKNRFRFRRYEQPKTRNCSSLCLYLSVVQSEQSGHCPSDGSPTASSMGS